MSNASSASGTKISASEAESTSLCRVSGYLYDIHGNPIKSQKITLRNVHAPMLYGATITIVKEHQTVRTDSTGLLTFDAYRGGKVKIELPGRILDRILVCNVPSAASANLNDILFPYVVSVEVSDDPSAVSISVDGSHTFTCVATLSDGEELDVTSATTLASSDEDIATFSGVTVTGVSAGTITVTLDTVDTDSLEVYQEPDGDVIERLSEEDISFQGAVTVTVS